MIAIISYKAINYVFQKLDKVDGQIHCFLELMVFLFVCLP